MDFDEQRGSLRKRKNADESLAAPSEELRTYIRPQLTDGVDVGGKDIIR